jgi:hypothetical protein
VSGFKTKAATAQLGLLQFTLYQSYKLKLSSVLNQYRGFL